MKEVITSEIESPSKICSTGKLKWSEMTPEQRKAEYKKALDNLQWAKEFMDSYERKHKRLAKES